MHKDFESLGDKCIEKKQYWKGFQYYRKGGCRLKQSQWIHATATSSKDMSNLIKFLVKTILLEDNNEEAREKLTLLYCQSGQDKEAGRILSKAGFTHRLSKHVLNYSTDSSTISEKSLDNKRYLKVFDNTWNQSVLSDLQRCFNSKGSFWVDHKYNEYQNSGYFSYVYQLREDPKTLVEQAIRAIYELLLKEFPDKAKHVKTAEWWCHSRPHHMGHQFHFDSENEGKGRIRHPLLSTVLYLSDNECNGPTLITNQKLGGDLADKGWIAIPKVNRLVAFDATYLHGVVPGKGFANNLHDRRVTFMVGFWDSITVQTGPGIGASRNTPYESKWSQEMSMSNNVTTSDEIHQVNPSTVESVWESAKGETLIDLKLPPYEQCFQGF